VGRFGWSAEWLWLIPLAVAIEHNRSLERWIRPAVAASLVYQVLLAFRWLPNPRLLYMSLDEKLDARDSLFAPVLRRFVPSFYFWDFSSYWTYLPNVIAYVFVLALLALGAAWAIRVARRRSPV
jgi:hypothetical protein